MDGSSCQLNKTSSVPDHESGALNSPQLLSQAELAVTDPKAEGKQSSEVSEWSTPAVAPSAWCSKDYIVGAGMVIIQQKTHKIVVIHAPDWERKWFFPRGRKDVGESVEQTAIREAYEESGYHARLLPLLNPTNQPFPPSMENPQSALNTESVFMTTVLYQGVYLTSWFVGQISEDAVIDASRERMPSEENFQTLLLSYDEAMERINGSEINVLRYAWDVYQKTLNFLEQQRGAYKKSNAYYPLCEWKGLILYRMKCNARNVCWRTIADCCFGVRGVGF